MTHIKIIAVGNIKEKYLREGCGEYIKRLSPHASVKIVEINEEKIGSPSLDKEARAKEGTRILEALKGSSFSFALCIDGKSYSSLDFAKVIRDTLLKGHSDLAFVIGGSTGLDESIIKAVNMKLSFSSMTFPHQLMRLILLEQIYRAWTINLGYPYHK